MTKKQFESPLTADGTYVFPTLTPNREYVVELSGSFGGGEATFGYVSNSGVFVAYADPALADTDLFADSDRAEIVTLPRSGKFAVSIAGSTTPSIYFTADILP